MYTVIVHTMKDSVINFATCKSLDRAVRMADGLRLEAWVIVTATSEVVYTNR